MRNNNIKKLAFLLLPLCFTAGCAQDMQYVSAKRYLYQTDTSIAALSPEEQAAAAHALAPARVHKIRKNSNVLGHVHLKESAESQADPVVFDIRKEYRSYMAETPIASGFKAGDKIITPHFAMGVHKDHKAMAGLKFRMPF